MANKNFNELHSGYFAIYRYGVFSVRVKLKRVLTIAQIHKQLIDASMFSIQNDNLCNFISSKNKKCMFLVMIKILHNLIKNVSQKMICLGSNNFHNRM